MCQEQVFCVLETLLDGVRQKYLIKMFVTECFKGNSCVRYNCCVLDTGVLVLYTSIACQIQVLWCYIQVLRVRYSCSVLYTGVVCQIQVLYLFWCQRDYCCQKGKKYYVLEKKSLRVFVCQKHMSCVRDRFYVSHSFRQNILYILFCYIHFWALETVDLRQKICQKYCQESFSYV